jgi:hypothetical protein
MSKRECGSCSLCCKVLDVPAVYKPAGQWCKHFKAGDGCGIHQLRPKSCRDFACLWLADMAFDDSWKPSNSKFVLTQGFNGEAVMVHVDPKLKNAWRAEPFHSALRALAGRLLTKNQLVMIVEPTKRIVLTPDQEIEVGHPSLHLAWEVKAGEGAHFNIEFDIVEDESKAGPTRFDQLEEAVGTAPQPPGMAPPPARQTPADDFASISFSR